MSSLTINRVVHPVTEHINVPKGDDQQMEPMPSKEYKFGNTTVIIHSKLVNMTSEERREWFEREWENGNPWLKNIVAAVQDCVQSSK